MFRAKPGSVLSLAAAMLVLGVDAARSADQAVGTANAEMLASAKMVLGPSSPWRWSSIWSKPMVSAAALKAAGKTGTQPIAVKPKSAFYRLQNEFEKPDMPPPPTGWAGPDFDDIGWARSPLPISDPQFVSAPLLMVRGRFEVANPAGVKSLHLTVGYRGGAVVYLNGREVARLDLPPGEITPSTPGALYPEEAWVDAAGKALPAPQNVKPEHKDRLAQRERQCGPVELPASALHRGVNVLAVELHRSDIHPIALTWWSAPGDPWAYGRYCGWAPVALTDLRLAAAGEGLAGNLDRPAGIQVWNCTPTDTITAFEYGDPGVPLRPVMISAARNGVFSGRLVVSSEQALKGLKVTVSDLALAGGGVPLPAAAVRVRCAEPATPDKSWAPPHRFDGLADVIPLEIPVVKAAPPPAYAKRTCGALAPLWFTVRVPKDVRPGRYEGSVNITADGLKLTTVPLTVEVAAWALPDARDLRVQNFAFLSEDSEAQYYGVPRWSDRHFELMSKAMSLMADANSRQALVNLTIDFYGLAGNAETMVRWIKQADGSFKYDFAIFDKYLDMVAKTIGKPSLLRLNCWPEVGAYNKYREGDARAAPCAIRVTTLDPATGKLGVLDQPCPGTEESFTFWKPVLDEVRKRIEARGWFDVTALGHNSYASAPLLPVVSVAKRIWPDGVWSYTAHNGVLGGRWSAAEKGVTMPVRYADALWSMGRLAQGRGYSALLQPRPSIWCYTFRSDFRVWTDLSMPRTIPEEEIMRRHDGVSDFGADLFPIKNPTGRGFRALGNGRGTGGPNDSTLALLAPGPDGAMASERFEMLREGVELAEAILFVQRALEERKTSGDLEQRANRLLDDRVELLLHEVARRRWTPIDRFERDAALLSLAGEVAAALRP